MAPRKNIEKKPPVVKKTRVVKFTKQGIKKAKPQKKSPRAAKLKVSDSSSKPTKTMRKKTVTTKKVVSPKITRKQLTVQKKIELANEVANTQLIKKEEPFELPALDTPLLEPKYVITITHAANASKRAVKRKECPVQSDFMESEKISGTGSEEAFELTPKKRKYVRKVPLKTNQMTKPKQLPRKYKVATNKPEEILTSEKMKPLPRKYKVATNKPEEILTSEKILELTKITNAETGITRTVKQPKQSAKRPAQRKVTNAPTTRKKKLVTEIGKLENDTSSTDIQASPSLLEQVEYKLPKTDFLLESPSKSNTLAAPIESRKTSMTGVSDCFSWTKNISSSSTTTCISVCSNDFVRIDNKLPIVKVTNVEYRPSVTPDEDDYDSSSDSTSSSSGFTPRTPERESSPEIDARTLDLSTSSISKHPKSPTISCENSNQSNETNVTKRDLILEKLKKTLKNVDLEILNWMGYDSAQVVGNISKFQENTIKFFQEESDVIVYCQCIKQALNPNKKKDDENATDLAIPVNICRNNIVNQPTNVPKVNYDNNEDKNESPPRTENNNTKDYENKFTFDRVKHLDYSCDDDDALSLFAESITGIESSKLNVSESNHDDSIVDELEEYIPQPITKDKWKSPNNINYVPSKITNNDVQNHDIKKIVCEKQTADSTSISKDTEQIKVFKQISFDNSQADAPKHVVNNSSQNSKFVAPETRKTPILMSSLYKSLHGIKSIVFRGICFFNLISGCKNPVCRFPHIILDDNDMRIKLIRLSEDIFVQEYMLLRNWPVLRRKYGMVFVEECQRRDLTRYLVEMAIDFHMKANDNIREDAILKVEVIEFVLLHLNTVDLNTCEDLLLYNIQKDYLLCDVFMQSIADTQNFSRFKIVFINLTDFMIRHARMFNVDVATHILERLCILPCEQPLSVALLRIIENTNNVIFSHSMMGHFEKQLSGLNKDLYEKLIALKTKYLNRPALMNRTDKTLNPEPEVTIKPLVPDERGKRYTSPDTTNFDNMNKSLDDLAISRTLDHNRVQKFNVQRTSTASSNSNDSNEENRAHVAAKPSPVYRTWRGQSVFNKIRELSPGNRPRQFVGPMIKRRIHQQNHYGPSPPNFPRRFGPDF